MLVVKLLLRLIDQEVWDIKRTEISRGLREYGKRDMRDQNSLEI